MFLIVKQICGDKLGASDGEIGHVKDAYFDDQDWTVRYLVADTGSWLPGRLVLLSPHAVGELHETGKVLHVNLTRQQIENSPPIESHKPVSRQYEEEYHLYYNWPFYWEGDGLWGMSGFPVLARRPEPFQGERATATGGQPATGDSHLRSAKTVAGYHVQAGGEKFGRVTDFVMDAKTWAIRHLVVDTGHWLSDESVLISPKQLKRISWDESTVHLDMTREAVLAAPVFDPAAFGIVKHDSRLLL